MSDAPAPQVRTEWVGHTLVITLQNPPVNVIGRALRQGLADALDLAQGAARVVITGAGSAFAAGADAKEFNAPPAPPHLPDLLLRVERLPAIAAINGAALGGGLEIALACRMRIAAPGATLGLPEVTLGVVPGAGGTQRLPRLIGVGRAARLISEGRVLTAAEALAEDLVDAMADDPLAAALAADPAAHLSARDRAAPRPDPGAVEAARGLAALRARGQIAPGVALDLVAMAANVPLDQGLAAERAAFLDLRQGPQARALRHVFFAERSAQSRARDFPAPPFEVARAVVVGGGTMGAGIALALAGAGVHVTTLERDDAAVVRARDTVAGLYRESVKRGKMTPEQMDAALSSCHAFSAHDTDLPPAELAIEAAFEDLQVKRDIFARLANTLPATTILATNTSYLDVNAIFEGIPGPGRCLGLHFFAPAHVMKLLEVIRARDTTPETLSVAFTLARRLRKIAVEAGVCDGFIGNRILTRYRRTTDKLLLQGALPWTVDAAMEDWGMAMGPYAVQDLSGLDIAYANRRRKSPVQLAPIADALVEGPGRLGRKTGAGWYDYVDGRPVPSPLVEGIVMAASAKAGVTRREVMKDEIVDRATLAMMAEGLAILDEGIAQRAADIDLVLIHGYGFPRHRCGPMHVATETGLAEVRRRLAAHAAEDPAEWRIPTLLDRLVETGASLP